MRRFLPILVWLVVGAVMAAAQCSAACLVSVCPIASSRTASPCHHAPGKKAPHCPLQKNQLHRAIASVDLWQHADAPLAATPVSLFPEASASANLVLDVANIRGAPPGNSLLLLLSTLRL